MWAVWLLEISSLRLSFCVMRQHFVQKFPSAVSVTAQTAHCGPDRRASVSPPQHLWSEDWGSIIEKQKLGHPCFRDPLVCMCETQATSTIHALQTATSFRHTFKGKVTSSHYTACTHYSVLYIDPPFICRMCTSLCIN